MNIKRDYHLITIGIILSVRLPIWQTPILAQGITTNTASTGQVSGLALYLQATYQNTTITTPAQLDTTIQDYNTNCGNGDIKTVTVDGLLPLNSALTTINNATTAQLIIQGDGNDTLDGTNTVRLLNIDNGNVTVNNMTLQNGSASEAGAIRLSQCE